MSNTEQRKQSMKNNKNSTLASIKLAYSSDNKSEPIHCFYIGNDRKIDKRVSKNKSEAFQNSTSPQHFLSPDEFIDSLIDKIDFNIAQKQKSVNDIASFLKNYKIEIGKAIDTMETALNDTIKPYDFAGEFLQQLANDVFKNNQSGLLVELDKACEFLEHSKIDTCDLNTSFEKRMQVVQNIFKIQLNAITEDIQAIANDINELAQNSYKKPETDIDLAQYYLEIAIKELSKSSIIESKDLENQNKLLESSSPQNLKPNPISNQLISNVGQSRVLRPKFTGNPAEDLDLLIKISKDLKLSDKIFLNFNRYKIEWNNSTLKMMQDLPYDKKIMGKIVDVVVELGAKVKELIFHYSNDELHPDQCKQLAQLQNYNPKHTYYNYNHTIQANFSSSNKNFNQLSSQLTQLTPSHLVYLHLDARNSGFGNDEAHKIATTLNSIQCLSRLHLNLYSNKIQTEGSIQIAQALQNSHFLSNLFLDFRYNNMQQEGAKQFSTALQKNANISSLEIYLGHTGIENDGTSNIAQALKMLPNITNLILAIGWNKLNDTGATAIANALTTFEHSSTFTLNLYLRDNQIGDAGAKEIARALATLKGLSHLVLQLHNNKIGNAGAIEIANSLKTLKGFSFLYLDLSNNEYTEEAKKHFQGLKADNLLIQKT